MSQNLFAKPSIIACVTEIVSSHVSNNSVPVAEIPALIASVHAALAQLDPSLVSPGDIGSDPQLGSEKGIFRLHDVQPLAAHAVMGQVAPALKPAVPIEDSIQHEYLVCLEDGKRLRMLKRYLRTQFGLTPDDYRTKWGLPRTYPMAAPAVIEQRRVHAVTAGLGRKQGSENGKPKGRRSVAAS